MAETLEQLVDRAHWTVEGTVATYAPQAGGWTARVTAVRIAGHSYEGWHVAIIGPHGRAVRTVHATLIGEACRLAEGYVRGQQPE